MLKPERLWKVAAYSQRTRMPCTAQRKYYNCILVAFSITIACVGCSTSLEERGRNANRLHITANYSNRYYRSTVHFNTFRSPSTAHSQNLPLQACLNLYGKQVDFNAFHQMHDRCSKQLAKNLNSSNFGLFLAICSKKKTNTRNRIPKRLLIG